MKFFNLILPFILCINVSDALIINEIMYNPEGDDEGHEWIEAYNDGMDPIDIGNWIFDEAGTNHDLNAIIGNPVIEPGQYAIIADEWEIFLIDHAEFNGTLIDSSWSSLSNS